MVTFSPRVKQTMDIIRTDKPRAAGDEIIFFHHDSTCRCEERFLDSNIQSMEIASATDRPRNDIIILFFLFPKRHQFLINP